MSFGGKFNYAKEYAKYKPNQPDSIFEKYVEKTPDLLAAWNQIKDDPTGTQGSYWKPRGATSKAAFGRAHAAESGALKSGTYHGGTDVIPSSGKTRFETFMDTLSKGKEKDNGKKVPYGTYTGDNPYYPVLDTAYSAPEVPNWAEGGGGLIPDSYAPWSQASTEYIPQNIWEGNPLQEGLGKGITYSAPPTGLLTIPQPKDSGSKTSGKTITDTSGNKWVMAPGGSFIPAGSDYATALAAGNAADANHYDSSGNYIGANSQASEDTSGAVDVFGLRGAFDAANDPTGLGGWL